MRKVQVALQFGFQVCRRIGDQFGKAGDALFLQCAVFSMHQRQVNEDAAHPRQLPVFFMRQRLQRELLGARVTVKRLAGAAKHIARELIEQ